MRKIAERIDAHKRVERDLITMGIAIAAILMFVGTSGSVVPQIFRSWVHDSAGPDNLLITASLLNIALIIFGIRRYRELASEIAVRRSAEAKAQQLSDTDPLTNCLNRRSIGPATDVLIQESVENGVNVAFLMVDLDNFKQINDLYGHKIGDEVLINVAEAMRKALPDEGLLARLGGDEFACVVPFDKNSLDVLDQISNKLISDVSGKRFIENIALQVTVSLGIATNILEVGSKETNHDAQTLLHRADIAMYHAKKQGKNRHCWYEPTMGEELRFRNEIELGIRQGIANKEFVPFYEQQVDLNTGELTGFEMLARWQSPELGLVNPTVFIPIAEEIGVIAELSEGLIEKALIDAHDWDPKLTVSVNISPVQLRDPWFSQKMLKLLVKHNFPAQRLEIEITESCLHENIGIVKSMITSLKNQGVKISLDDFGTGYSSLTQLRSLPFDRLKIDSSFVSEMTGEQADEKIVNAIISLGNGLSLPMTAEGIEDDEILAALRSKGELKGQGYHYGRPEPACEVRSRLSRLGLLANDFNLEHPVTDEVPNSAEEPPQSMQG